MLELLLALVTGSIIALATAQLFKAGILTYNYTMNQSRALSSGSKALYHDGGNFGVVWAVHSLHTVSALTANSLTVVSTSGVTTNFYVANNNLYNVIGGRSHVQAEDVKSLTINYYNLDASGLVIESTASVSAMFVTSTIKVAGRGHSARNYTFYSGGMSRNR